MAAKKNILTVFYAAAIVIIVASLPLIINGSFYFEDDWQAGGMPNMLEIARLVKLGHVPLLTDRLWVGGMFLGEYQTAIFHPISILLYLIIDKIDALNVAAAIFTISHMAILAVGTTFLALVLKCNRRASLLAGVVVPTMSSLIYWGAKIWIPVLVSMAWMSIALAMLVLVYRSKKWFPLAIVTNALVFLAGYPSTNLAFIIAVSFSLGAVIFQTREWKNVFITGLTLVFGLMLAAPAILPLTEMLQYSARSIDPDQWKTSIDLIPGIGVPSFMTVWKNFGRVYYPVHNTPILYVSWFVPLVLVNASWKILWYSKPMFRLIVGLTILFAAISMLPGFWQFRWAFRYLPYFHFSLVILTIYIISNDVDSLRRWGSLKSLLVIIIPFYIALVYAQELWMIHLLFLVLIALFFGWYVFRKNNNKEAIAVLLAGHAALFVCVSMIWESNYQGVPIAKHELHRSTFVMNDSRRFALYSSVNSEDAGFWSSVAPGNRGLYFYRESINGYSPFFPIGFKEKYCFNFIGGVCPQVVEHLFSTEKITGKKYLDLLNVSTMVVEKGVFLKLFLAKAGDEWTLKHSGAIADIYVKKNDTLARNNIFSSETLQVRVVESEIGNIKLNINSLDDNQNIKYLIWSRPWYPGWRVYLNGQELRADRVADVLIGVLLPKDSNGTLLIEYWPKSLTIGLWLSVIALLVITVSLSLIWRINYRPEL